MQQQTHNYQYANSMLQLLDYTSITNVYWRLKTKSATEEQLLLTTSRTTLSIQNENDDRKKLVYATESVFLYKD